MVPWILAMAMLFHPLCVASNSTAGINATHGIDSISEVLESDEAQRDEAEDLHYLSPPAGPITGKILRISDERKVVAYLGVPYAQPPTGQLRFKPPAKLAPWKDVFNATEFGPLCVQSRSRYHWDVVTRKNGKPVLKRIGLREYPQSEDCLNLNIYIPYQGFERKNLSVMVYIHGGSYKTNGGRFYPGQWLASKGDLVVITLNYRLGVLGFLSTGDAASRGNYGLYDQLMALQWIQENIDSFGGNPNDVTIFGNSAGGACVGIHLLSSLSTGYFHKAIIQSGSPMGEWAIQKKPRFYTVQLASKLQCPNLVDSKKIVECLRSLSTEKIIEKSEDAKTLDGSLMLQFAPVVDGDFLKTPSLPDLMETSSITIPVIIGITKDELEIWMIRSYQDKDPSTIPFTKSLLRKYLLHIIRKDAMTSTAIDVLLHTVYTEYSREKRRSNATELGLNSSRPDIRTLGKIISDIDLKAPSVKFVELLSRYSQAPVFMYEFDYSSSDNVIVSRTWKGSYHESELNYVFGLPYMSLDNALRLDDDRKMSDTMIQLWSDFAKRGNPTPEKEISSTENFTWTRYTEEDKSYAVLSLQPRISRSYESERMIFWNHFVPMLTEYSVRKPMVHKCHMDFIVAIYIIGWLAFTLCLMLLAYLLCKRFKNIRMRSLPIPV